ncbi:MAG: DNA polymerase III subunit gamma/tau [Fuerstiella sp.]
MSTGSAETGAHYTVLARRFRPQAFDDVVGQEHVAQALRNAIRAGRVAHAYLFTGARGVGKTSTARILAKALNCPNVDDGVPCNNCEICDGISAGNDVDVLEIDGASNRGIDDIRSLRANVNVRSMRTQFKVYIIDEVHMLTREAFNALLKTLEEPPPNVKFVFCTTEPQKVPDTILSRCQRFDFSAIGEQSIGQRLKEIATAEGFDVEDEAVELVARRARGSMRDSQSLFDQLLAFSDGMIRAVDVHRMLGTASDDLLIELFAAMKDKRPGEVLNQLEHAMHAGVQAGELLDQCVGYVRDLMVTASGGATVPLCSVGVGRRDVLQDQAKSMGHANIMAAFQILSETKGRMIRSTFARVLLEMGLIQIAMLEDLSAVSKLLSGHLPDIDLQAMAASANASAAVEADSSAEKKNDLALNVEAVESSPAASKSEPVASPVETAPAPAPTHVASSAESSDANSAASQATAELKFDPANAMALLKRMAETADFKIAGALNAIVSAEIRLPDTLELKLPSSSEFKRRVLEQPESRTGIENLAENLTGLRPIIHLKMVASDAPAPAAAAGGGPGPASVPAVTGASQPKPAVPKSRNEPVAVRGAATMKVRDDINPENDAFVQHVVASFGATVVRITDAPRRRIAVADPDGVEGD